MAVTPINPNKPDTIVVEGNTVTNTHDPKWIDWGPDQPNPTFNIDDPKMWLPMTVISGLASGYCERAAVISGGIIASGVTWPELSVTGATATRSAIVSKLANNIAIGKMPGTTEQAKASMFADADATMVTPVSSATSTYMRSMDAMITTLIGPGGFAKVTTGSPATSYTFAELAANASSRSSACNSNINRSITSDAANYQSQFAIAYPSKWAEERKWMLDELRWTGSSITKSYATAVYGYRLWPDGEFADRSFTLGPGAQEAVASALYTSCIDSANRFDAQPLTQGDGFNFRTNMRIDGSTPTVGYMRTPDAPYYYDNSIAGFMTASVTAMNQNDTIAVYLGPIAPDANMYTDIDWNESDYSTIAGGTTTAVADTTTLNYNIQNGGELIVSSGAGYAGLKATGEVTVSAGGTLSIIRGSTIHAVNVMDGASLNFSGYVNGSRYQLPMAYLYTNYLCDGLHVNIDQNNFVYINTATPAGVLNTTSNYLWIDGCTCTYTNANTTDAPVTLALFNGAQVTIDGRIYGSLEIASGCSLMLTTTEAPNNKPSLYVLPGATCTVAATNVSSEVVASAVAYPDSLLNLESSHISELYVVEGATVNLTAATIDNCYVGKFATFGLTNVVKGWNFYKPTVPNNAYTGEVLLTGPTVLATAKTSAKTYASDIYNITAEAFPGVYKQTAGGTASSFADWIVDKKATGNVVVMNNFRVLALAGGNPSAENYYPSFRCRQLYTDIT